MRWLEAALRPPEIARLLAAHAWVGAPSTAATRRSRSARAARFTALNHPLGFSSCGSRPIRRGPRPLSTMRQPPRPRSTAARTLAPFQNTCIVIHHC